MAASSAVPGVVDSTKPKSYPVILSDALLGKTSKEAITAIRYNHRPTLSSDIGPNDAELKPSSSSDNSFDLSFYENGGKYAFNGTRSTKENQYVLLFDPERKAFVLHRLDSMLNMNVTRTPTNNDADDLREKHPHIDSNIRASTADNKKGGKAPASGGKAKENNSKKGAAAASSSTKKKDNAAAPSKPLEQQARSEQQKQQKQQQQQQQQQQSKSSSQAEKEKKRRNRSPVESEEDDDDDDGGLLVEYPDPAPSGPTRHDFSPAFPTTIRRFSEFVQNEKSESDEDADAEYEDDILGDDDDMGGMGDGFKLPNPVGGPDTANNLNNDSSSSSNNINIITSNTNEVAAEEDDDDGLGDLEKELEKELGMDIDSESSVSEED